MVGAELEASGAGLRIQSLIHGVEMRATGAAKVTHLTPSVADDPSWNVLSLWANAGSESGFGLDDACV